MLVAVLLEDPLLSLHIFTALPSAHPVTDLPVAPLQRFPHFATAPKPYSHSGPKGEVLCVPPSPELRPISRPSFSALPTTGWPPSHEPSPVGDWASVLTRWSAMGSSSKKSHR